MGFKVGNQVTWSSQSGGSHKEKIGFVVQVVEPGQYPDRERFASLYRGSGVGLFRDHVSYVVKVGSKIYWPRANQLKPAGGPRRWSSSHPGPTREMRDVVEASEYDKLKAAADKLAETLEKGARWFKEYGEAATFEDVAAEYRALFPKDKA